MAKPRCSRWWRKLRPGMREAVAAAKAGIAVETLAAVADRHVGAVLRRHAGRAAAPRMAGRRPRAGAVALREGGGGHERDARREDGKAQLAHTGIPCSQFRALSEARRGE